MLQNAPVAPILANDDGDKLPIGIDKPKIIHRQTGGLALALGGGAARGWAHIGVLRAMDEAGIAVSMIAGTSIGALVGGCYLAGKLDDLEEFARSISKRNIFRYLDFTFSGGGLISGERLASRMALHIEGLTIEDLERPFVGVATDIKTGHEIWLHDGPLIDAIRASYALPGIFQPVPHNGRLLVDGALVNPVPVSTCRAWEPNAVIAVNLNTEQFGKGTVIRENFRYDQREHIEELDTASGIYDWLPFMGRSDERNRENKKKNAARIGTTSVMIEAFNIIQDRIARSRLAGDPPDFTVRPKLGDIGMADFHRAAEAIDMGYAAGTSAASQLLETGQLAEI